MEPSTLEGTWEEILQHTAELAGQRVKVIILSREPSELSDQPSSLSDQDPLSTFIGAVTYGSLASNLDNELYGG